MLPETVWWESDASRRSKTERGIEEDRALPLPRRQGRMARCFGPISLEGAFGPNERRVGRAPSLLRLPEQGGVNNLKRVPRRKGLGRRGGGEEATEQKKRHVLHRRHVTWRDSTTYMLRGHIYSRMGRTHVA